MGSDIIDLGLGLSLWPLNAGLGLGICYLGLRPRDLGLEGCAFASALMALLT